MFSVFSCGAAIPKNVVLSQARQSFLYLEKKVVLEQCGDHRCLKQELNSMASSFVIKTTTDGSYGVTAAHVCDTRIPQTSTPIKHISTYTVTSLMGDEYKAVVLASDIKNDICLIYIKGLTNVPVIKLSNTAPKPGDTVYNIGAPRGIYQPNMVPMFEGIYNGKASLYAFYSLPANPGSSGSMILNEKGELIGVLHSVYIKFPQVVLSARYDVICEFIRKNIIKYETYKSVMSILDLKDVFAAHRP
tara:strand:- start:797 stop:1534 length:738 start_codon:yes stop_codon:yes gene_type:complete